MDPGGAPHPWIQYMFWIPITPIFTAHAGPSRSYQQILLMVGCFCCHKHDTMASHGNPIDDPGYGSQKQIICCLLCVNGSCHYYVVGVMAPELVIESKGVVGCGLGWVGKFRRRRRCRRRRVSRSTLGPQEVGPDPGPWALPWPIGPMAPCPLGPMGAYLN